MASTPPPSPSNNSNPPTLFSSTEKTELTKQKNKRSSPKESPEIEQKLSEAAKSMAEKKQTSSSPPLSSQHFVVPLTSSPVSLPKLPIAKPKARPKLTVEIPAQKEAASGEIVLLSSISSMQHVAPLHASAASIKQWTHEQLNVTPTYAEHSTEGLLKNLLGNVQLLASSNNLESIAHLMPKSTHAEGKKGISGSYFLCDIQGIRIAIFKPDDEELGTKNCPDPTRRSEHEEGARHGIKPGLSATLECIAYLLGKEEGVPPTVMVTLPCFRSFGCYNPVATKTGSLQMFAANATHFDIAVFRTLANKDKKLIFQMQTIALLDIKLFNTDRNDQNLLFTNQQYVPVDHGCIAAAGFVDDIKLCWMELPEVVDIPLGEEQKAKLAKLNWEQDKAQIQKYFPNLPKENLETLEASYILLNVASKYNLNLRQIASFLSPAPKGEAETSLERSVMYYLFKKAKATNNFSNEMRRLIDDTIKAFPSKQNLVLNPDDLTTFPPLQAIRHELFVADLEKSPSEKK